MLLEGGAVESLAAQAERQDINRQRQRERREGRGKVKVLQECLELQSAERSFHLAHFLRFQSV